MDKRRPPSRRDFLKAAGIAAAGVTLGETIPRIFVDDDPEIVEANDSKETVRHGPEADKDRRGGREDAGQTFTRNDIARPSSPTDSKSDYNENDEEAAVRHVLDDIDAGDSLLEDVVRDLHGRYEIERNDSGTSVRVKWPEDVIFLEPIKLVPNSENGEISLMWMDPGHIKLAADDPVGGEKVTYRVDRLQPLQVKDAIGILTAWFVKKHQEEMSLYFAYSKHKLTVDEVAQKAGELRSFYGRKIQEDLTRINSVATISVVMVL